MTEDTCPDCGGELIERWVANFCKIRQPMATFREKVATGETFVCQGCDYQWFLEELVAHDDHPFENRARWRQKYEQSLA